MGEHARAAVCVKWRAQPIIQVFGFRFTATPRPVAHVSAVQASRPIGAKTFLNKFSLDRRANVRSGMIRLICNICFAGRCAVSDLFVFFCAYRLLLLNLPTQHFSPKFGQTNVKTNPKDKLKLSTIEFSLTTNGRGSLPTKLEFPIFVKNRKLLNRKWKFRFRRKGCSAICSN